MVYRTQSASVEQQLIKGAQFHPICISVDWRLISHDNVLRSSSVVGEEAPVHESSVS